MGSLCAATHNIAASMYGHMLQVVHVEHVLALTLLRTPLSPRHCFLPVKAK